MKTIKNDIKLTAEERETHLNFDYINKMWYMDSSITRHFNKAVRTGWEPIAQYIDKDGIVYRMQLRAPERGITIKTPEKRKISAEHFAKLTSGSKETDSDCYDDDDE